MEFCVKLCLQDATGELDAMLLGVHGSAFFMVGCSWPIFSAICAVEMVLPDTYHMVTAKQKWRSARCAAMQGCPQQDMRENDLFARILSHQMNRLEGLKSFRCGSLLSLGLVCFVLN